MKTKKQKSASTLIIQMPLYIQKDLRNKISQVAELNHRSMTAEIVHRIETSLRDENCIS